MLIVTTENNVYVNIVKITFNCDEAIFYYEDGTLHTISAQNIKSIEADK